MRLPVEKLRWILLAGGACLLLVVVTLLGWSRYRSLRAWHRVLERTGASLTRETNGFTYSQSEGGHTVFTLHAAKAIQAKDGKYALRDVDLTLFRQAGGEPDRIYGSQFEYDQATGVARAIGEVQMDLQAPGARPGDSAEHAAGTSSSELHSGTARSKTELGTIHVKTSGLVYVRKLGVAATDQAVEFRYAGLECRSRGAEFDAGQSTIHLLADVRLTGDLRGRPVRLTSARADLDRASHVARLTQPEAHLPEGAASATSAVLHLSPDGRLTAAEAEGAVRLLRGSEEVRAERAELGMGEDSALKSLRLSGGVQLADADQRHPAHGHAETVQVRFGAHNSPAEVVGEGDVSLAQRELSGSAGSAPALQRTVSGSRITGLFAATFGRGVPKLRLLTIEGSARLSGEQHGTPVKGRVVQAERSTYADDLVQTRVGADALVLHFLASNRGQPQPQAAEGTGHTFLEQTLPGGTSRRSTGDRLTLAFAAGPSTHAPASTGSEAALTGGGLQLTSAVQQGHVALRSVVAGESRKPGAPAQMAQATSGRVEFEAAPHLVKLTGNAHLWSNDADLTAAAVELDTASGNASASGQVRATLLPATANQGAHPAADATHVAATTAHFERASDTIEFFGTAAQPAKLWQGASQLEAARVRLDRQQDTLSATSGSPGGLVRAVLVQPAPAASRTAGGPSSSGRKVDTVLRVRSARLEYSGLHHEATFSSGVTVSGDLGEARAENAVLFLQDGRPAPAKDGSNVLGMPNALLGGSVERVVFTGKVQLLQPGRRGTGEQLVYTAETSQLVLTGAPGRPPHVTDAEQGSLTGTTLVLRTGDNTVVVAGDPAHTGAAGGRVRTELNLHP